MHANSPRDNIGPEPGSMDRGWRLASGAGDGAQNRPHHIACTFTHPMVSFPDVIHTHKHKNRSNSLTETFLHKFSLPEVTHRSIEPRKRRGSRHRPLFAPALLHSVHSAPVRTFHQILPSRRHLQLANLLVGQI